MRIYATFGLLLCALALSLSACGGGDSTAASGDGNSTSPPMATTEGGATSGDTGGDAGPISKAALIKRGDAICEETDKIQRARLKEYEKENPGKPTPETVEASLKSVALPPIASEIEELEALGAPSEDSTEVAAIMAGLRRALEVVETNPSTLLKTEGPFRAPDELAATYGFKACAKAL